MKNLLLILFSGLSFSVLSQNIVKQKLFESKFIGWEIERAIFDDKDTVVYFSLGMQNAKYPTITDIMSIYIDRRNVLENFDNKLSEFASKEKGVEISSIIKNDDKEIILDLYDFSELIYVRTEGKHFRITKQKALNTSKEMLQNLHLLTK